MTAPAPQDPAARASAELTRRLPDHAERVGWDAGQLAAHQREQLRALLAHAAEHSPFHAKRLSGLDLSRFELSDLARLPVMSKGQMMAEFDEVVTDRRLSSRVVEQHLAASAEKFSLLFDEYVCYASGGSSGLRGVFVQTLGAYTELIASVIRVGYTRAVAALGAPPPELVTALIGADSPVHSSGCLTALLTGPPVRLVPVPATLPLPEMVARLNAAQPPAMLGYSAKLAELAREQLAGRLTIAPRSISCGGGPLTSADRAVIEQAFAVPVTNSFAGSEGLIGQSVPGESVMTFASDMCLVELVDDDNRPVPAGVPSAKVLLTNLYNLTQPLIRYELTDQFVRPEGAPEAGWLRASIYGRAEEVFHYGDAIVHLQVVRNVMAERAVGEYQVHQTAGGMDVECVAAGGDLDTPALTAQLETVLRQAGVTQPGVSVRQVEAIPLEVSGKVRPFIPL